MAKQRRHKVATMYCRVCDKQCNVGIVATCVKKRGAERGKSRGKKQKHKRK